MINSNHKLIWSLTIAANNQGKVRANIVVVPNQPDVTKNTCPDRNMAIVHMPVLKLSCRQFRFQVFLSMGLMSQIPKLEAATIKIAPSTP